MLKVLIIAGPSGTGKNTIIRKLLERCASCTRLVTATTREKREGEREGEDYYFITKQEFLKRVAEGSIPEYWHAKETDRYYGTYLPDLDSKKDSNTVLVAQMQTEGIKYFKEHFNTIVILLTPNSKEDLKNRITHRSGVSEVELDERLNLVDAELEELELISDYKIKNPDGKLNETVDKIILILKKEDYV